MAGHTYRDALPGDKETILKLGGPLFPHDEYRDAAIEGWMQTGDAGVLAELDASPIGVAWYRRLPFPLDYSKPRSQIACVFFRVCNEHRGRRIGTDLMSRLVDAALHRGEPELLGQVKRTNEVALKVCLNVGLQQMPSWPIEPGWVWVRIQLP